ncbi:MAG TPA: amidohydrolase family protein [Candidatus Methanofastidiosa archaeon]|nr:amidohydrolase family protein [Candidatus Methanofastidiosa archaeon]
MTPTGKQGKCLLIDGERVSELGPCGKGAPPGHVLLPSFIDMHVHFRDFEQSAKETVKTGSMAALAGGASAVCDMPNTVPPVSSRDIYERRQALFERDSMCDFLINFCIYDKASLEAAKNVDAFFIKIFLGETTGSYVLDPDLLEDVFRLRRPIAIHADIDGMKSSIKYSKRFGTPLHICHVSKREEVELIAGNKDGNITCEATPHHLFLSGEYDVKPPLCNETDKRYLWASLGNVIDIVSSDHAPHTLEDKDAGAYGVSGIETLVPLMYTALSRGNISYENFCNCMYLNQSRILSRLGRDFGFGLGGRADFTILDTSETFSIDPGNFHSKAKHSPFEGFGVDARISETWVRGKPFFIDGKFLEGANGKQISKGYRFNHKA